jgi:hypothetical protein
MNKTPKSKVHDPRKLGWMKGFPPPHEKVVRFAEKSFYAWPQLRWSLSHIDELMPTKRVWRVGQILVASCLKGRGCSMTRRL